METKQTKLTSIVLLVTLGVCALFLVSGNSPERVITIATPRLAVLPPHEHAPGEADSDPGHGLYVDSIPFTVPENVWVTGLSLTVENAPQQLILHHMWVMSTRPDGKGDRILMPFGRDNATTTITFDAPYGMYLQKGSKLYLLGMLHNPEPPEGPGDTYHNVRTRVDVRVTTDPLARSRSLIFQDLTLFGERDGTPPHTAISFSVPPNTMGYVKMPDLTSATSTSEFTFATDAVVYGQGIHLHAWEGGKEITAYLNGVPFEHFSEHQNPRISYVWTADDIRTPRMFTKGDQLSISAVYDNPDNVPLRGAMGELGFFYYPIPESCVLSKP